MLPGESVRACPKTLIAWRGLLVAVTNLPSHFAIAADRLRGNKLVSAALGMHPLSATEGIRELAAFKRMATHVNFIGEIGLDFFRQGVASENIQERVFEEVLCTVKVRRPPFWLGFVSTELRRESFIGSPGREKS